MRSAYLDSWGPLGLRLPSDPDPCPGVDWGALYRRGGSHAHQDDQDRLNADRTWGTNDAQAPGGSGIALAYSQPDVAAVRVAFMGWKNNPVKPNPEHACRDGLYDLAGFEMTGEAQFARGVQAVATRCTVWPWFEMDGEVRLDDPGYRPQNLDNLMAYAQAHPHQGLRYVNIRALGWAMYFKAAEVYCLKKMARSAVATISTAWLEKALDVLDLAAMPGTGQIEFGDFDEQHPIDQLGCEYSFHKGILAMGAMACAKQCGRPLPTWVRQWLEAAAVLPAMTYSPYGAASLPSFTFSVGGKLYVASGSGQNGDPAFGWHQSACVGAAMLDVANRAHWLSLATRWGPTVWDGKDEQTRKFTMLYRGALAAMST